MCERLRRQTDSGQDLVEYALAFPVLMLLILGIIEFGVIVWSYDTIANAAREGARYGIIHPNDTSGIEAVTRERALALTGPMDVATQIDANENIEVRVTYEVQPFTPLVPHIQLETAASMRIELVGRE